MTNLPLMEIVIAIHDLTRPIRRAVTSILDGADGQARVIVVCHGLSMADVSTAVGTEAGEQVRYLEFADGIRSPAGPFNAGLAAATAEYVGIMGSDDYLEPGAIGSWARYLRAEDPDIALMPLTHQSGEPIVAPLRRWGRRRRLSPVRDRLFYRSAPLGLLRRSLVESLGVRLIPEMRTGEDLEMSSRLWASGARIDMMVGAPAYVIGADATQRVSTQRTPTQVQLQPVARLVGTDWFATASAPVRRSLATKLIRIHILDSLRAHQEREDWGPEDIEFVHALIDSLRFAETGVLTGLCRADRNLIDAVTEKARDSDIVAAIEARTSASWLSTLLTRNVMHSFCRESVLRRYFLYGVLR